METKKGINNLIPTSERTKEEARELGRQGGIRSGEVRREKKALRETLNYLLELKVKDKNGKPVLNPIDGQPMDYQTSGMVKLAIDYAKGDHDAIRIVQSIKGEETKNIKLDADVKADVDVSTMPDKILFDIADKLQGIDGE